MDPYIRNLLFVLSVWLTLKGVACGKQKQDAPVGAMASATSTVNVYMAQDQITVGDIGLDYVDITIFQSMTSNSSTSIQLDMDNMDGGSRYAYLEGEYLTIYQGSTNVTTRLQFEVWDDGFYTEEGIFNITISYCNPSCETTEPRSTIVRVLPEKNVSVSFDYGDTHTSEENYCDDPRSCNYGYFYISTSRKIVGNYLLIPLKIGDNSTATYIDDYFFDIDPPAANLSGYDSGLRVYISNDKLVEGTEYLYLSFDKDNLPPRVVVGETGSRALSIYDDDYGRIIVRGANANYSEDAGIANIVVETNYLPESDLPLNVDSYSYDGATPGEDFVPFDGTYYILAGTNSTSIPVTIIDDDLAENREAISFTIEAYLESSGDNSYEHGTIYIDDDESRGNPLVFSFDRTSAIVDESSGTVEFLITANIKNDAYVLLDYYPAEVNGLMEYVDYSSYFNNTIRRNVFQFQKTTEKLITVDIIDDCEVEEDEQLTLNISLTSIGSADLTFGNLTITVKDNDEEGRVMCSACACSHRDANEGVATTVEPTTERPEEPAPLMFNFEIDEFDIYEGECSFYDVYVTANQPTSATVFIGVQPYELDYGTDFTIGAKKLVFEDSNRQNFSFRALQDLEEEDVESTLLTIAYSSEGSVGPGNAILVHVWNENDTMTEMAASRFARSIGDKPPMTESRVEESRSDAIATGLVAGLVSSLLVITMTTILFGVAVVMRNRKGSS